MNKKTVGSHAIESVSKEAPTLDPIELQREMQKGYEQEVIKALESGKKKYPDDFYVVVLYKKERLLPNVVRAYFFTTLACPTPQYDQIVYRYGRSDDSIEFIWTIPSKDTCEVFRDNVLQVEEKELLQHVLDFYDGTLDRRCKLLNKEIGNE